MKPINSSRLWNYFMRRLNLLGVCVVLGFGLVVGARAATNCYVIVDGDGAGTEFVAVNGVVADTQSGHNGFIVFGSYPECPCTGHAGHYHGTLFGFNDPDPEGCGWGCVDLVPCNSAEALVTLRNDVGNAITNPALAAKINGILDVAAGAVSNQCNSLLRGALQAAGEEIFGAVLGGELGGTALDTLLHDFAQFARTAFDDITLGFPPAPPPPKPCTVMLLLRRGSGAPKLVDAGKKYYNDRGEVAVLDAFGCPGNGPYSWSYTFKGAAAGEVPSGTGVSFAGQRFCVLSERTGSVKITVEFVCPDGKVVKDSITINFE